MALPTAEHAADSALQSIFASVSERQLQALVLGLAHLGGWLAFHRHLSIHSARGFPDCLLVRSRDLHHYGPPWVVFAELKTEQGRLRPEQRTWRAVLESVAHVTPAITYRLWRPSDKAAIEALLLGPAAAQTAGSAHYPPEALP